MKRILLFIFLFAVAVNESKGQFTRYLVKLKNKNGTPYSLASPLAYLSQRSIDRRTRYGILLDSTDLPVTPSYITQIRNVANVTILNISKWLNQVSILTTDANAVTTISAFPFVQSVSGLAPRPAGNNPVSQSKFDMEELTTVLPVQRTTQTTVDFFNYGAGSFNEIHLHNGEFLHNIGLRGQGMVITMLDGGFFNYTGLKAFDSANANGQILSTWDFVAGNSIVTDDIAHGMQCLSTIVANIPGQFIGKAPKASFHLFRTEDAATEFPIEEHNWASGAERGDSLGSDAISSSLGYNTFDSSTFDHTYAQMDGNTTMSAIAADLAAKKGLLVFNAAGNEGTSSWHFIITPADGDSVVAVGAVNTAGVVGSFSSYGPSSDGQIKPDLASIGVSALVQATNNTVGTSSGTSFACPNMAGLGTCLWQGFPEFNNMKILRAMQQAGSIAGTPNDRIGYGIPDMKSAFAGLLVDFATSSSSLTGCKVTVSWTSKDIAAMKYEIERKAPGETVFTKIGEVNPLAGDILANHNYQFDNNLTSGSAGSFSYRIRQIIDTSSSSSIAAYIDTTNINVSSPCIVTGTIDPGTGPDFVKIIPNPAGGNPVTLIVQTNYAVQDMPVAVYDMKGRLMMQLQRSKPTGRVVIEIPVSLLAKGRYIIKVYNQQKTIGTAGLLKL